MPRFAVCSFLDSDAVPELFRTDAIPPHVTVVGNFRFDGDVQALTEATARIAEWLPVEAVVGSDAGFGPSKDVPVVVLNATDEVDALHSLLLGELNRPGIEIESPEYSGVGYRAHITRTPGWDAAEGAPIVLNSLSLIELDAESNPRRHRVAATFRPA